MKKQILDCTLREAPLEGCLWGDLSIRKIISGLESANIDIIEVGFLKNEAYRYGSTSFQKVEEIEPYLNHKKKDKLYVALVDYGRYDLKYLSEYNGKSIDAIRICFKKDEIEQVVEYAKEIREKGYQVCIQHVDTLAYTDEEIIEFIKQVNTFQPYSYAVVDTFGAMYESEMIHLVKLADSYLDKNIHLGFHGHNNMMLANANAQRFIYEMGCKRNIIVDASLYGCGRGAGNAHTELLVQYMIKKENAKYDINEILDLIDTVISAAQEKTNWGYSIPYFISAMHNAHTFNAKQLLLRHNIKSKDLRGIIEMLDDNQKKTYDYELLERLYVQYFNHPINDKEMINHLAKIFENRKILLMAPGKSLVTEHDAISKFIIKNNPIIIGINNLIEDYKFDYIFYSGIHRYHNLQYQNYEKAGSPKLILSSNIKTVASENEMIVDYGSLVKHGWVNLDSSAILLLRLLLRCNVQEVFVAGLDGYTNKENTFYKSELNIGMDKEEMSMHNRDNLLMIEEMLNDNPEFSIHFITESIYSQFE